MKTKIIKFLFLSCLLSIGVPTHAIKDVQGIYYGVELPYSYHLGWYAKKGNRFAIIGNAKIFATPVNQGYTMMMGLWGADEKKLDILRKVYRFGFGFEGRGHYYFGTDNRRYYVGITAQLILLPKIGISDYVINNAYNIDLNSHEFPEDPIAKRTSTEPLTLKTTYANVGIFAGKRFFYMEPGFEMFVEIGLNKTVFSHHRLNSDYRFISPADEMNNEALKNILWKYGWAPGINISLIKKIK